VRPSLRSLRFARQFSSYGWSRSGMGSPVSGRSSNSPRSVASRICLSIQLSQLSLGGLRAVIVSACRLPPLRGLRGLARLGVADALAQGPAPPQELASRVGADRLSLERVLRALEDAGLFTSLEDGRIALTDLGQMLRSDVPGSARRGAIASTVEWRWRAYGHLTHSVRTGEPGFRQAHGCGLWEYLDRDPDAATMFNESMSRVASANAAAIVRAYDFSRVQRLVDVGGGHGALVQAVLEANPQMRAVVFDLPGVIEGTRARLADAGLTDRCEVIAGDFFQAVPTGGDAYVLSWILHDWDDRSATRILANCRAAMLEGGRLLAIEMVVPSGDEPRSSPDLDRLVKTADLEMLAIVGGRERTAAEYRKLYANAGFELTRILPLDSLPWSVLEGVSRSSSAL
jgi:hypothetical protein